MPLTNIFEVELFDVWRIDFMGLFPPSFENLYILITIDCVQMGGSYSTTKKYYQSRGEIPSEEHMYKIWDF